MQPAIWYLGVIHIIIFCFQITPASDILHLSALGAHIHFQNMTAAARCMLIILHLMLKIDASIISKRRLCVEHVIPDYNSEDDPVTSLAVSSFHECFVYCVRRGDCTTFQYQNGTCELLPTPSECLVFKTDGNSGMTYVGLRVCDQQLPWVTFKPEEANWQWIQLTDPVTTTAFHPDLVKIGIIYAIRVFHKGLYLPGYWKATDGKSRTIIPFVANGKCICSDAPTEFLLIPGFTLATFNAGDPVPVNAVLGGHWIDGSPLYVIFGDVSGTDISGYYNPNTKNSYIFKNVLLSPAVMKIALYP